MLGGSIFSQLGVLIKNPASIASSIGTALPTASNFFINYIVLQVPFNPLVELALFQGRWCAEISSSTWTWKREKMFLNLLFASL